MSLVVTVPPTFLPLSLAAAKRHIGISGNSRDLDIEKLIKAGANYLTRRTGRALALTTYTLSYEGFPVGCLAIPYAPLSSITSVYYYDTDGADTEYTNYQLSTDDEVRSIIYPGIGTSWPSVQDDRVDAVRVIYSAGYATEDDVPAEAVQFLKVWCRNQYDHPDGELFDPNAAGIDSLARSLWVGDYADSLTF